ncbi:MAG: acetyl-CoA carboxylase, carboxyltransferase subunit beta [Acholeplasmatales bacterium]|nr:acetyl-CoA carboxylase, carboxyltransferase subunit beta [Acholeplasmatales bacterium]
MSNAFDKRKQELNQFSEALDKLNIRKKETTITPKALPDDVTKCPKCNTLIFSDEMQKNLFICPKCNHHFRITPKNRLDALMDKYEVIFDDIAEKYTDFPDYKEKLSKAVEDTNEDESITCAVGYIDGIKVLVGVMNSFFMMGSMGSVCGEKVTRMAEKAYKENLPLVIFTCSGGARMQEGIISLMQMAKTSAAFAKLNEKGLYIAVITDPTTGGVSASFASLADITLAEPGALFGFAGKRVIESTIKEVLPKEFQTAEFNLEKGFIDKIVSRKDMKKTLSLILSLHGYKHE